MKSWWSVWLECNEKSLRNSGESEIVKLRGDFVRLLVDQITQDLHWNLLGHSRLQPENLIEIRWVVFFHCHSLWPLLSKNGEENVFWLTSEIVKLPGYFLQFVVEKITQDLRNSDGSFNYWYHDDKVDCKC